MFNKPHDVTALAVIKFTQNLFRTLAERYGGDCTLNELRVINQMKVCHLAGRTCCVTALHKVTGIPIPTVSRSVANLQRDGWLSERRDPVDGRKRIISLRPHALDLTCNDISEAIQWINDLREDGLSA